jgi:hypothetical protein
MVTRAVALLIALVARVFAIIACGLGALLAIDAWQHAALPIGTTFGIVFDRLEWAIYGAFAAGLILAVALVLLQARRFSLTERIGLSCSAAIVSVVGFFWFAV